MSWEDRDSTLIGEYGAYRVVRRSRPGSDIQDVVIMRKDGIDGLHKVLFDGSDLVVIPQDEGVSLDWEEDSFLTFSGGVEPDIRDMFFAIAKAFGMHEDVDAAFKDGWLKGENRVLWEWVRSKGRPDKAPSLPTYNPTANRWSMASFTGTGVASQAPPTVTYNTPTFPTDDIPGG